MSYQELNQYNSPNYTDAASVPAVFGRARTVESITIHWWGDPSEHPTFEGTINYLCTPWQERSNQKQSSAHAVVEAGRVAWIIDGTDAAWHAGSAIGNATSIGVECNPRASDGDYQTVGELVRDIRAIYGDIPIRPHNSWISTACPGTYNLARIDAIARGASAAPAPAPAPKPAPAPAPAPVQQGNGKTPYCTVEAGDTGYGISRQFGVPFDKLQAYNPGVNWNALNVGQRIYLVNWCRVEAGDTGYGVAAQMGISFAQLSAYNPGVNWNALKVGQELWLE